MKEILEKQDVLLKNIKENLPYLEKLLEQSDSHWGLEDLMYRFYHQSFKVYQIQSITQTIYNALKSISPHEPKEIPNKQFSKIIKEGASGKQFKIEHNKEGDKICRPFLEAFFHSRYFLDMAIKYGKKYKQAPQIIYSGWATLLGLYEIR